MHTLTHTDWVFPYGNTEAYKGTVTDGSSAAFSSLRRGCKQTNDSSMHDPPTHTYTHIHTHSVSLGGIRCVEEVKGKGMALSILTATLSSSGKLTPFWCSVRTK